MKENTEETARIEREKVETILKTAAPLKLERGGIYVLECERILDQHVFESLKESLVPCEKKLGVKFLVLDASLKIARTKAE